jgi:hypothetical protein
LDDPPNNARVNAVTSVTQHVAEAADALPRLIGRNRLGLVSQPPSSLADDQERVQDGLKCLLVSGKTIGIKPCREPLYSIDILKDIGKSLYLLFRRQAPHLARWRAGAAPCEPAHSQYRPDSLVSLEGAASARPTGRNTQSHARAFPDSVGRPHLHPNGQSHRPERQTRRWTSSLSLQPLARPHALAVAQGYYLCPSG